MEPTEPTQVGFPVRLSSPTITVSAEGLGTRRRFEHKVADSPTASTTAEGSGGFGNFSFTADSFQPGSASYAEEDMAADELLANAAVRADQQERCRETMLDLREAFEEALYAQRGLQARQAKERQERHRLIEALRNMEEKVEAAEQRIAELHASHRALEQELEEVYRHREASTVDTGAAELLREQAAAELLEERAKLARLEEASRMEIEEKTKQLQEEIGEKRKAMKERVEALQQLAKLEQEQAALQAEVQAERARAKIDLEKEQVKVLQTEETCRKKIASISKRLKEEQQEKELLSEECAAALRKVGTVDKERNALQAEKTILQKSLEKVMMQVQQMEMSLRKAKRNSSEALQERLNTMMADLEAAKRKMSNLGTDRDRALESNAWLSGELNRKTRQQQLERQFLPFIRTAHGPLGGGPQKVNMSMTASASDSRLDMLR